MPSFKGNNCCLTVILCNKSAILNIFSTKRVLYIISAFIFVCHSIHIPVCVCVTWWSCFIFFHKFLLCLRGLWFCVLFSWDLLYLWVNINSMIANILFSFIASSSCILLQTNQIAFTLFESPWTLLTWLQNWLNNLGNILLKH